MELERGTLLSHPPLIHSSLSLSTLMRRIATGTLPGFPPHLCVAQVKQELPYLNHPDSLNITPVEYCVQFNPLRKTLLKKISQIENGEIGEEGEDDEEEEDLQDPEKQASILCELYDLLEDDNLITARAVNILKDLGFGEKRRSLPLSKMSGGWKMRASIACALAQEPDILLLDEPTNHLDMEGVEWLVSYLNGPLASDLTVLVTSHDSHFLDEICTDIIRFAHRQLTPYVGESLSLSLSPCLTSPLEGNYSAYESIKHDKDLMNTRVQDGLDKQRKHLEDQIRRMQVAAHRDTTGKSNGQIASKKKKLARHGYEKNVNGHRFRAQHEATAKRVSMRAGSQNGSSVLFCSFLWFLTHSLSAQKPHSEPRLGNLVA
jgi:ATP-binding cassette, subfamily F, member 3